MAFVAGGRPQDKPLIERGRQYLADHLLDEGDEDCSFIVKGCNHRDEHIAVSGPHIAHGCRQRHVPDTPVSAELNCPSMLSRTS